MVPVIESLSNDIEDAFEGSIRRKLEEGATTAENEASNTCSLWGSKVCHTSKYANFLSIKNSEYDQEIPQSQLADNPMARRGRATQPSQDTRKTN